jgi:hypothetical protein
MAELTGARRPGDIAKVPVITAPTRPILWCVLKGVRVAGMPEQTGASI